MEFIWICLYGLTWQIAEKLTEAGITGQWVKPLAILLYTAALLIWLHHSGRAGMIRLCWIRQSSARLWEIALFLLLFPAYNLLLSVHLQKDPALIIVTGLACLIEEIFFRGFLLQYLKRYGTRVCVLISSGLFALYHLGNLFAIQDIGYVLLQTVSAFSAGICYAVSVILTGSLLPCVLSHILTNLTAAPVTDAQTGLLWVCIGLSCFSYFYFLRKSSDHNHRG